MSTLLTELEATGYRFHLDGEKVIVRGSGSLLESKRLAELRQCKPNILAELRLRKFVDLVRATAACEYQILLHRRDIEGELDAGAIGDLRKNSREERQAWAASIAYRLTRPPRLGCAR